MYTSIDYLFGLLDQIKQIITCFEIKNLVFLIQRKRPDFVEFVILKKLIFGSLGVKN